MKFYACHKKSFFSSDFRSEGSATKKRGRSGIKNVSSINREGAFFVEHEVRGYAHSSCDKLIWEVALVVSAASDIRENKD